MMEIGAMAYVETCWSMRYSDWSGVVWMAVESGAVNDTVPDHAVVVGVLPVGACARGYLFADRRAR